MTNTNMSDKDLQELSKHVASLYPGHQDCMPLHQNLGAVMRLAIQNKFTVRQNFDESTEVYDLADEWECYEIHANHDGDSVQATIVAILYGLIKASPVSEKG